MRHFLLMLLIFTVAAFVPTARGAEPESRTISTMGEATVYVVPDRVTVNLGVESYRKSLDDAKTSNETDANSLMKAIQAMGIDKKDIATDNMQVEIHYVTLRDNEQRTIAGYFVRRGYAVTLKDPKQFEKLIDTALKNGANQIHEVSFTTTESRKYRDQARKMAINAAKEKAVLLAGELSIKVGAARTISGGDGTTAFRGYQWNSYYGGGMSQNAMQVVDGPADTGENLTLGLIAVSASVSVTFDLQ